MWRETTRRTRPHTIRSSSSRHDAFRTPRTSRSRVLWRLSLTVATLCLVGPLGACSARRSRYFLSRTLPLRVANEAPNQISPRRATRHRRGHTRLPHAQGAGWARPLRRSMNARPKSCSAASALWARQRSSRFSRVAGPPRAKGRSWWSSSSAVSRQRWPPASTYAQRSLSRSRTARRTAAGTVPRRRGSGWTGGRLDAPARDGTGRSASRRVRGRVLLLRARRPACAAHGDAPLRWTGPAVRARADPALVRAGRRTPAKR